MKPTTVNETMNATTTENMRELTAGDLSKVAGGGGVREQVSLSFAAIKFEYCEQKP